MKKTFSTILLSFSIFINPSHLVAQDTLLFKDSINPIQVPLFGLKSPIEDIIKNIESKQTQKVDQPITRVEIGEDDKIILARIADIYRLHVLSLESQINNDHISTEKYITNSISELQSMLEENPDVQQNKRFAELYRTILTEYREFYGTSDTGMDEEGEIFNILDEMFVENENELDDNNFSLPNMVLNKKKFSVPLPQNKYVNNHLSYLWIKRPEIMETWLQRKEKYFPMIEKIFEEERVPKELMHLAMIESGLNPSAKSRAAAVGMWQFIKATGSVYGLEVNWWVDERRDPVKATRAAARHLSDLYKIWGDWHLALANYNVSPRRMKQAIRKSDGVKDYWVIYPYLPRETRGYVPSFIATTMISTNPEEFGFKSKYGEKPFEFETVEVNGSYDLKVLADAAGISLDEIKEYNTALIRWATPPGSYPLRLPVGAKETFTANFKDLPVSTRTEQVFVHNVKRGESIGKIASKYGVSVRDIYDANDKLGKIIRIGQEIVVPIPADKITTISADKPSNSSVASSRTSSRSSKSSVDQPSNTVALTYTVKSGDTIGEIAEWYRTYARNIRDWNNVGNFIRVGQKLTVYVPKSQVSQFDDINELSTREKNNRLKSKSSSTNLASANTNQSDFVTHKVKSNDNLFDISVSYGVSISEIKKLNRLKKNTIYPGQVLKIKEK